jgi:hypothetical protein
MASSHPSICREKAFGPRQAVLLDRNAKARIAAFASALSHRNRWAFADLQKLGDTGRSDELLARLHYRRIFIHAVDTDNAHR